VKKRGRTDISLRNESKTARSPVTHDAVMSAGESLRCDETAEIHRGSTLPSSSSRTNQRALASLPPPPPQPPLPPMAETALVEAVVRGRAIGLRAQPCTPNLGTR